MCVIRKNLFTAGMILLACTLLGGCVSFGNHGHARHDAGLLQSFNNFELNSSYDYYLYGAGNNYYALLGLNPEYTVPIHKMWKAMPVNDPEMRAISMFLWEKSPLYFRAAYILYDSNGKILGELYTSTTFSYLIEEDNTLIFYFQTPWMNDLYF